MTARKSLFAIMFLWLCITQASASETLQLMNTITIDRDSIRIGSVDPVGDFNNDGYEDIAISFYDPSPRRKFEAVYLYYGGPDFNTQPDLIFYGDTLGCCPGENMTGFGYPVSLKDFNGDGYEDMAISAGAYCWGWYTGRIYIYFGSTNPDTVADMIIDGGQAEDRLGCTFGGDYNGDGLGDFIASASNEAYGYKVFIYTGGNPPDTIYDWSYIYYEQRILSLHGNSDINSDGNDDFGWFVNFDTAYESYILLGNEDLDQIHTDTLNNLLLDFIGDISGDGIDDFAIVDGRNPYSAGWYLCLGGNPLDLNPDCYLWTLNYSHFIYHGAGQQNKLIRNIDNDRQLILYNIGVPFDTLPIAILNYSSQYFERQIEDIGDINDDGYDEIAMPGRSYNYIDLYSIITTGIEEQDNSGLPVGHSLITCYPNPFNSATMITIDNLIEKGGKARLEIYNLLGQLINSLSVPDKHDGRPIRVIWDAKDFSDNPIANGLYFIRLNAQNQLLTAKVIYLK